MILAHLVLVSALSGFTAGALDPSAVNNPQTASVIGPKAEGEPVVRAQVLLDRAHFSCGEIDGAFGTNLEKAVRAFQAARNLPQSGTVDAGTWAALNKDSAPALINYTISPQDIAGPFAKVPG